MASCIPLQVNPGTGDNRIHVAKAQKMQSDFTEFLRGAYSNLLLRMLCTVLFIH